MSEANNQKLWYQRKAIVIDPASPPSWYGDQREIDYPDGTKGPDRSFLFEIFYKSSGILSPAPAERPSRWRRLFGNLLYQLERQ